MVFEQIVKFYKLNDDASITVKVGDDKYFRCRARLDIVLAMKDKKQDEEFVGKFGLGYVKGVQGLVLQLIEVN